MTRKDAYEGIPHTFLMISGVFGHLGGGRGRVERVAKGSRILALREINR